MEAAVRNTHGRFPNGSIVSRAIARKHIMLPVTFVMSKTPRFPGTFERKNGNKKTCLRFCTRNKR
jgi:hypothetical protein